ncbi:serine/threonine-protein kinase Sgk1-like isoform X2 [Oratosquilla oratoria]|uniref:serine/threonine-protein kinase Sgk1-like isoform X2 n=1 Tax=Oratosquilla oratoria TaxID=337810 RepID=UPI003F768A2D
MSSQCPFPFCFLQAFKDCCVSNCYPTIEAEPFVNSSNNSSNIALDNASGRDRSVSCDSFEDEFAQRVLGGDNQNLKWRPQLRLHEEEFDSDGVPSQSIFYDVDLGLGVRGLDAGSAAFQNGAFEPDENESQSTRESGYGRSLGDSEDSTILDSDTSVNVTHSRNFSNYTAYKVVVQTKTRCWFILRRYNEFYKLNELIKKRMGEVDLPLPPKKLLRSQCSDAVAERCRGLDAFIQAIMANPRIVQLPEVREFLQLDRFQSTSSSSSSNSDSVPAPSPIVLDPRFLMPIPGAPSLNRKTVTAPKPIGESKGQEGEDGNYEDQEMLDLGVEKRSLKPSDFEFLSVVGKGSFGKVMLARLREDQHVYAVKVLNKKMLIRRNETQHVLSERSVLIKVLKHPYLVQLHFAFTTETKVFFVLDYINGGEGIVYRDLKPENILLDREGHVVLTDFGLCKEGLQTNSAHTSTFCGTPEYLAPEILRKQPYSRSVDWWTLGAVLYEMIYGLPPFYSRDTAIMYDAILHKQLKLKESASSKARNLLEKLLKKDASVRLGSGPGDVDEVKSHSFFNSVNWDHVDQRKLKPPFVPSVAGDTDTRNVDPMFTKEPVHSVTPSTPSAGISASVQASDHFFKGFSYAPPLEDCLVD